MFFFNLFSCADDVFSSFNVPPSEQEGVRILVAWYKDEDYQGDAWVLFEKGGKLYEVNGSHCSCMGLENQWAPEEVSAAFLHEKVVPGLTYTTLPNEVKAAITRAINPLWELSAVAFEEEN